MSQLTRSQRLVRYLLISMVGMIGIEVICWGQPFLPSLVGCAYIPLVILTSLWIESKLLRKQK